MNWITRCEKYQPLPSSHHGYGNLDPKIKHRWDIVRFFLFRTTASDEFLIECERDRLVSPGAPPPLRALPQVVQDRMNALGLSGGAEDKARKVLGLKAKKQAKAVLKRKERLKLCDLSEKTVPHCAPQSHCTALCM